MWPYKTLIMLLLLAAAASLAWVHGRSAWAGKALALNARLDAARQPVATARFDGAELDSLPEPVQRFFSAALTPGQPMVIGVRLRHSGEFNMGQTKPAWKPFESSQRVAARRPGFVWEARIPMLAGLPAYVHDAYAAGEGVLNASLLGLFDVVDLRGTPAMAQGELLRYLAEAPWYPTALLPSQGVRWEAIDARSARAHLRDGDTEVSIVFFFGDDGLIERSRADARMRVVAGASLDQPWGGRYWNAQRREGMRIPIDAEVAWLEPHGPYPYWRARITDIAYEFASPP